ncbi:MAG: hypothetical protein A3F91_09915 [Flavobacteria bacterium RIFCSPLOWO2_12_FULL_35_11]|nr:MAG: hypothetical protein A3F91_09915 [Flavobacteria bacterium RIFCSPLOWO2_12_FULL_35_11]
MKKILLSVALFLTATFSTAMEYKDDKMDSWRDGFITAYKAMEVDVSMQGLESKKIDTKKYIIYFDANGEDIADWDRLMVQMFGYSSSVHKPVRTVDNWIIFNSYDNKATALQETVIMNERIFKNSKKYKLQVYENKDNRVFLNDKALFSSQLKELEELFKVVEKQKIEEKQKDLEDNQKVAIVYVDSATGAILKDGAKYKVSTNVPTPTVDEVKSAINSEKKVEETKIAEEKHIFKKIEKYVKAKAGSEVFVFRNTVFDSKNKVRNGGTGEVYEIEAENSLGWYKIKDRGEYIPSHQTHITGEKDFLTYKNKMKKVEKLVVREEPKESKEPKEKSLGEFTISDDDVILYLLPNFKAKTDTYLVEDFKIEKVMKNTYTKFKYSHIVKDKDGAVYYKIFGENRFVPKNSLYILE